MKSTEIVPYSQLRHQRRVPLAESIPLAGPLAINIEPGNACNFKCTFCPESLPDYRQRAGGLHALTVEQFTMIASQIKELGRIRALSMHMLGEPFVNRRTPEFIRTAKEMDIADRVLVTSNGSRINTPELFDAICRSGLDHLRISCYGSTEEEHKARTQSPISLATVKSNIQKFQKFRDEHGYLRPFICMKYVSSSPEADEAFRNYFEGVGDERIVQPLNNWHDNENLSGKTTDELMALPEFRKVAQVKQVCPFPFYTLVIHADLRVSVCCVDWDKQTVVGDLRTETLSEIWRGPALRKFQLLHLQRRRSEIPACANCTFIHTTTDDIDSLDESVLSRIE